MLYKGISPGRPISSCREGHGDQGFTLLEVIVATALMGVALVVLLELLGASVVWQGTARSRRQAAQLAEMVLGEFSYNKNLRTGNFHGQKGGYNYTVRVTPQYEAERLRYRDKIVCFLIQVEVTWRERGSNKVLQLSTMRTVIREGA